MTLFELRFKEHKKIRRASWKPGDYLQVVGWGYNGTEWAYDAGGEAPNGLLHVAGRETDTPFQINAGHKGTDWEILE